MAQRQKLPAPVMRSRTGLDADDAPRQLAKEGQDLRTPQLPMDDHRAGRINPVNLKNRLGDIQTNRCNSCMDGSSQLGSLQQQPQCGT